MEDNAAHTRRAPEPLGLTATQLARAAKARLRAAARALRAARKVHAARASRRRAKMDAAMERSAVACYLQLCSQHLQERGLGHGTDADLPQAVRAMLWHQAVSITNQAAGANGHT